MEELCLAAFNDGDRERALEYLPQCSDPSSIRTESRDTKGVLSIQNITLLHLAAKNDWPDVITTLIRDYGCDKEAPNNRGSTPSHYSARYGSLAALKCLVEEHECNPMRRTKNLWTCLHWAATKGRANVLRYLIDDRKCDPTSSDKYGHNLLHLTCSSGHKEATAYLLQTGLVDPSLTDAWDCTPSKWGRITAPGNEENGAIKILEHYEKCRLKFPIDTYSKVFVLGNKGVGKSTLVKVLEERSKQFWECDSEGNVEGVELHTVGMIPVDVRSVELGNMIVYDLAGESEYYYSHAAVLQSAVETSSAMFVVVVDVSEESLSCLLEKVSYWFSFVSGLNMASKAKLVVVGSHIDLLPVEPAETVLKEVEERIMDISECHSSIIDYTGFMTMDCRKVDSSEIVSFSQRLLLNSLPILAQSINVNYTCHTLCYFLKSKVKSFYCQLKDLLLLIEKNNTEWFLPTDQFVLSELLSILSKQGFILYLHNDSEISESWVVVDLKCLLHEIHGEIFHPKHSKHDVKSVSNIGIIPLTWLKEILPDHSSDVIAALLGTFEMCHVIKDESGKSLMFFPALVNSKCPDQLPSQFSFTWILKCTQKFSTFPVKFCHTLLRQLALSFPLDFVSGFSFFLPEASRRCFLWKRGIYWINDDSVQTLVEFSSDFKSVCLKMNWIDETKVEMMELRSSVISNIRSVCAKCCPSITSTEFLKVQFNGSEYDVSVKDFARVTCLKSYGILHPLGRICIPMSALNVGEPYLDVPLCVLVKMFSEESSNTMMSQEDLQSIKYNFNWLPIDLPISYDAFKQSITQYSMLSEKDLADVMNHKDIRKKLMRCPLKKGISQTIYISGISYCSDDLPDVIGLEQIRDVSDFLKHFPKWYELGVHLGISITKLKCIEKTHSDLSRCVIEIVDTWIQSSSKPPTKWMLMDALKSLADCDQKS